MKQQVGIIKPGNGINVEAFKQGFRDTFENVDTSKEKPMKLAFVENDGVIEVWEE